MYISHNIKFLRKSRGLNQSDLADRFGITNTQIGAYELGKSLPPLDKVFALAEFFEVEVGALLTEDLAAPARSGGGAAASKMSDAESASLEKLVLQLERQVQQYERIIKKRLPELAEELGLGD